MRNLLTALLLILTPLPGLAQTRTYRWVDEAGAVHYTQGTGSVPERYRSQARQVAIEPPPSSPAPAEKPPRPPSSPAASRDSSWKPSEPLPEITMVSFPHASKILVPVRINGRGPVTLLLDTRARGTVVSEQALQRLGISGARHFCDSCWLDGFGWRVKAEEVQVLYLEVGEAKLTGSAFIKDLDVIASSADGILGRDFLDNFTVTIDPKQRLLTLAPATLPASDEGEPSTPSAQSTRISFPSYQDILVTAKINDQGPVTLLLDTGADRTWVTAQALRRLGIPVTYGGHGTFDGIGEVGLAQVASMGVGEVKVESLPIYAFDERASKASDGLLGLDFLNHFTVTIDPKAGVVTLTATTDAGEQVVTPIPDPDLAVVQGDATIAPREQAVIPEGPPQQQVTEVIPERSPRRQVSGATPARRGQPLWAVAAVLVVLGVWTLEILRRRREDRSSDQSLVQHPGTPGPSGRHGHLKCPQCSARLTRLDTDEGIEVHWCQKCHGTWHDKGVFDEFTKLSGLPELLQEKPVSSHPSDWRCPRCVARMEKRALGAKKFLVDCCPSCQGLWLDRGEVAKLGQPAEAKPQRP